MRLRYLYPNVSVTNPRPERLPPMTLENQCLQTLVASELLELETCIIADRRTLSDLASAGASKMDAGGRIAASVAGVHLASLATEIASNERAHEILTYLLGQSQ